MCGGAVAGDETLVVVGRVDAERGLVDHADEDCVAGLEDAELLETFDLLERAQGQRARRSRKSRR